MGARGRKSTGIYSNRKTCLCNQTTSTSKALLFTTNFPPPFASNVTRCIQTLHQKVLVLVSTSLYTRAQLKHTTTVKHAINNTDQSSTQLVTIHKPCIQFIISERPPSGGRRLTVLFPYLPSLSVCLLPSPRYIITHFFFFLSFFFLGSLLSLVTGAAFWAGAD